MKTTLLLSSCLCWGSGCVTLGPTVRDPLSDDAAREQVTEQGLPIPPWNAPVFNFDPGADTRPDRFRYQEPVSARASSVVDRAIRSVARPISELMEVDGEFAQTVTEFGFDRELAQFQAGLRSRRESAFQPGGKLSGWAAAQARPEGESELSLGADLDADGHVDQWTAVLESERAAFDETGHP